MTTQILSPEVVERDPSTTLEVSSIGMELDSTRSKHDAEIAVSDMLNHAYSWLSRAVASTDTNPMHVKEVRAYAYTVSEATKQRDLSRSIQMDAQEMARRADYALGKAIRDGQENGTITKRGIHKTADCSLSPKDIASNAELFGDARDGQGNGIYALADNASPAEFESALTEAKAEGNLSRANLVRKIKPLGESKPEKVTVIDPDTGDMREMDRPVSKRLSRIFDTLIISATPLQDVIELVNWESIPKGQARIWHEQLSEAIKELQKINRQLDRRANQ